MNRVDLVKSLPENAIGIELGVARGLFSAALLEHGPFSVLFSIDMWAGEAGRAHDDKEYRVACERLRLFGNRSVVLKGIFERMVGHFPNNFFDFIYVDGYAHTGQEGGKTLAQWWSKLKPGGLFAGHDYSRRWPKTVAEVDAFVQSKPNLQLCITDEEEVGAVYRSWFLRKRGR